MPLTAIDPKTALLVVDLQQGIINQPLAHPIEGVIANNQLLLTHFREHNLPVVLINVAGGAPGRTEQPRRHRTITPDFTAFIPELNQQPTDITITKHTWGAFVNTTLEAQLHALDITQVIVTGVATGTGVESTARQAYELGFNVTLATDAMTDARPIAHDYSLAHVFPRLGETGTTQQILDLMKAGA